MICYLYHGVMVVFLLIVFLVEARVTDIERCFILVSDVSRDWIFDMGKYFS